MNKVRCKKSLGEWFYEKVVPDDYSELDAPIYTLYDSKQNFVSTFGSYGDMRLYIETGRIYC